jgi:Spy/CpxP family protein refolding chaperone
MSDNRPRIWFSLFVLAVFCVGLASGVLLGRRMVGPPGRPFGDFGGPPGLAGGRRGGPPPGILLDRLNRELSLTEDQRARIGVVLKTSRERLDGLQQETHNRLENEQHALRDEIRTQLTPEQQQKFDRWIEENPPRGPGRRDRGERPPGGLP